jgi:ribosomal protein S18 acetylase RimI-like enzyme
VPPEGPVLPVRLARAEEIEVVQAVAVAAGRRFAEIDDPRIARCAGDPPPATEVLLAAVAEQRLWLAEADGTVVGFLLVVDLPRAVHVEEVSVLPGHQGRGHGATLLDAASARARAREVPDVTLTTFADVPFNRPWYERRGFRVLDEHELDDALIVIRSQEAAHGLDPALRVVMARPVPWPATD